MPQVSAKGLAREPAISDVAATHLLVLPLVQALDLWSLVVRCELERQCFSPFVVWPVRLRMSSFLARQTLPRTCVKFVRFVRPDLLEKWGISLQPRLHRTS